MAVRKKPIYHYPEFITSIQIEAAKNKRYVLSLDLDTDGSEDLLVILKNPSRANQEVSDKTVYNVCNYVFKNATAQPALQNIGRIVIANLMPHYLTDSTRLQKRKRQLYDPKNMETIATLCHRIPKVIIAWGNAPKGVEDLYEQLKAEVLQQLKLQHNKVYYVKSLSQRGNPRHGQVWSYSDPLLPYTL